ncbi:helix-turn-helix transcriptional regulator [Streptomyces sp. NPDC051954]|uniref:helix-turn-helix domain-containing protein n=1 Tax=Streptomyces sp. NPDC051954 TaxID=3155524 RepID=UPI00342C4B0A
MGRPEKPADQTNPHLADLVLALRAMRRRAGLTYRDLAELAPISRATLQRAAGGTQVPEWETVIWYWFYCYAERPEGQPSREHILALWRAARRELRGKLGLRAPRPEYVADGADFGTALRHLYESNGALPYHVMRALSRDPRALPPSTFRRIVDGRTIPKYKAQILAFIRACGAKNEDAWLQAWHKAMLTPGTWGTGFRWATSDEIRDLGLNEARVTPV